MLRLCVLIGVLSLVQAHTEDALKDQVFSLPRATPIKSNQFSGFLDISSTKNIHYMYYESENNPATDPVVFWTNGGPGCSGLLEFGPWRPVQNGSLVSNPWSWTKLANLVFLEQPVGVGFSYGTDPDELLAYNDYRASIDNLLTIQTFFRRFPERAKQDFYVASESYGGHYIPQWTLQLFGDETLRKTFKGMMVGNPFTSYASGSIAMANVMWGLQMIPKPLWDAFVSMGCDSLDSSALDLAASPLCFVLLDTIFNLAGPVNPYALDFPVCTLKNETMNSYAYSYYSYYYSNHFADDFFPAHDDDESNSRLQPSQSEGTRSHEWTRSLSRQAQTLLKVHERIMKSNMFQRSLKSYRAAHPDHVEQINAILSGSTNEVKLDGVTPPRPPHSRNSRRLSDVTTSEAYNITYDPCTADYTIAYLSDPEVQAALHVLRPSEDDPSKLVSITWAECDDYVNGRWSFSDYLSDTTDLYATMFNHADKPEGFKMLVFSGDSDGVCATVGTQNWIYNITGSEVVSLYKPWYYKDSVYSTQQGGYLTQFNGQLSFATVHHAGHEVPAYQPQMALELFQQYLKGTLFYNSGETSVGTSSNGSSGSLSVQGTAIVVILVIAAVIAVAFGCAACYRSHVARKAALIFYFVYFQDKISDLFSKAVDHLYWNKIEMAVYRTATEQVVVFLTTVGLIFLVIGLCFYFKEDLSYSAVRVQYEVGALKMENTAVSPIELKHSFDSTLQSRPAIVEIPPAAEELPYRTLYDVIESWNPDSVDPPADFKETLQHFDYSNPRERQIAERYRDAEVPFKLYNVPEFNNVTALWTDEYLTQAFSGRTRYHVERSKDNHFMFWSNRNGGGRGYKPPTEMINGMNFPTWRQLAKEADEKKLKNDSIHYYFIAGADAHENGRTFISRDLPLLSTEKNNFFITKVSANKGIQCRFGMRGVIAESHYDSGKNMVVMLRGAKRYIINPPRACPKLAIISEKRHPSFRHSVIDWSDINQARSHEFDKVEAIDTIVHTGEILYIPSFWFHYIISLEYSIQCNSRSGFPESMYGKSDIDKCYSTSGVKG